MNIYSVLAVGAGGFLGSVGRYLCVQYVDRFANSHIPFGTFTVNVLGSFLLGIFAGMSLHDDSNRFNTKLFLTTGLCGGFTTFSAFALENVNLVQQKYTSVALIYTIASFAASVVAIVAGLWLGKKISGTT
jgi:fluoride exporter